jgi:hypothetical protein
MYIIHSTSSNNLISIINTGILYANKYIDTSRRRMSGPIESQYIFTSAYISNENSNSIISDKITNYGPTLIFSSDIMNKEAYIFNYGWCAKPSFDSIFGYVDDKDTIKKQKKNKIIKYVKKSKKITDFELLFIAMIYIKDYLIGISYPDCDIKTLNKINLLLKKNKMDNVQVFI